MKNKKNEKKKPKKQTKRPLVIKTGIRAGGDDAYPDP